MFPSCHAIIDPLCMAKQGLARQYVNNGTAMETKNSDGAIQFSIKNYIENSGF